MLQKDERLRSLRNDTHHGREGRLMAHLKHELHKTNALEFPDKLLLISPDIYLYN